MVGWVTVYGLCTVCMCSGVSVELVNVIDSSTSVWVHWLDILILAGSYCSKRQLSHLIKAGDDLGILLVQHVDHVRHLLYCWCNSVVVVVNSWHNVPGYVLSRCLKSSCRLCSRSFWMALRSTLGILMVVGFGVLPLLCKAVWLVGSLVANICWLFVFVVGSGGKLWGS